MNKKNFLNYLQIFYLGILIVSLHGCLNVNLKSVLPDQTYYSLDKIVPENTCKNITTNLALNVSVLSPYDGKDILAYNEQEEIKVLESYKWIDLPKNMIRNAFIKVGLNHCVHVEQNPLITQKIFTLRLNINDFYVQTQKDSYNAHVTLYYELLGYSMNRLTQNIITINMQDSNPAKAMQNAMIEALNKAATQIKAYK